MTSGAQTIRQDSKQRLLGDKSYVGDQEIIGKLQVKNDAEAIVFEFDPDTQKLTSYDDSGHAVFEVDTINGLFTMYDTDGNVVWQVDISTGVIITGTHGALKVNAGIYNNILIGYQLNGFGVGKNYGIKVARDGYPVETATDAQLIMSSKFTMPRETNISFGNWSYTNNTNYEFLYNNACKVDFDDWPDSSCYLEVTGKTGGGTAYYSLHNVTDNIGVDGSECTTTSTTATVFRSGAFDKPSGSKQLCLMYKVSSAAFYTDIYSCRVVMRYI